ncbi:ATP-binding protein [Nonomuraea zeae]|uniref:ATP-binding protein n=1 Tax=Nonomuraea zeae TaxID=1642303 RepID=UPI0019803758|nr:ATP-binding protein [Nonomuraea zeae]
MDRLEARHALFGREPELRRLREAIARIADGAGEALLLTGEAGVGKTSLLGQAAALATGNVAGGASGRGIRVLRAAGTQFEAEISYAALHQLLHPCLGEASRLSPLLTGALNVALGLGEGAAPEPLLVATAVLALLTATGGPVLLVIDDLPWLDAPARSCSAWWQDA